MKILCGPPEFDFASVKSDLDVELYGRRNGGARGCIGAAIVKQIKRQKLQPTTRAWDFLSIALSIISADLAGHRDSSGDGWTRQFQIDVTVSDPAFWSSQTQSLQQLMHFLTTDTWLFNFLPGGSIPQPPTDPVFPPEESVVLLSGGLDSFIGVADLSAAGKKPFAISQSVRGDAEKQQRIASLIGGGLRHLQLNHNADLPNPEEPPSQRARSIAFYAYGILAATTLSGYRDGRTIVLNVCENGFITINPPLTDSRLGSLSTRTSHPVVLTLLQRILSEAGLRVQIENPYRHMTKGEMLGECKDQTLLKAHAHETTSCGRFKRFGYRHCGRCVPCLIRRAAFHAWGQPDQTLYVYSDIGADDKKHAGFDDVRAASLAVVRAKEDGFDQWLGTALSSPLINEVDSYRETVRRGLAELESFLEISGVK